MAGDMAAAKAAAAKAVDARYIDVIPHAVLAMAADKDGDAETTARERAVAKGLLDSLIAGGAGKTPEAPMKVVNIDEEYALLTVLGLRFKGQSLVASPSKAPLDRIAAAKEDVEAVLYFDVSIPMAAYGR